MKKRNYENVDSLIKRHHIWLDVLDKIVAVRDIWQAGNHHTAAAMFQTVVGLIEDLKNIDRRTVFSVLDDVLELERRAWDVAKELGIDVSQNPKDHSR